MSRTAEAPVHKVTLNLFADDYELLKEHYGDGWSVVVRAVIKKHADEIRRERR